MIFVLNKCKKEFNDEWKTTTTTYIINSFMTLEILVKKTNNRK